MNIATKVSRSPRYRTLPSSDALAARLARAWGVTENTASVYTWGEQSVFRRAAIAVRVMVEDGDDEALIRCLALIEEAKQPTHPEPLTPDLWLSEAEADHAEDVRQEALHVIGDRAAAEAYIRAGDAQQARYLRIRRAVVAHYGLA